MFNDILTGKATNETEQRAENPYRPDPGPGDLVCTSCQRTFPASQSLAGRCRNCAPNVDAALHAMRGPKANYTDHGANDRTRDFGLALIIVGVIAAAIFGFAYNRYQARKQLEADIQESLETWQPRSSYY